jgi:REP element-mobilizing transposase RayT
MVVTLSTDNFEIYKRYLPHWRANNVIYFTTWRLQQAHESLSPEERSLVAGVVEFFHKKRYWLLAYVIMDDHVHVLVRLPQDRPLQTVLHSWKSYSANQLQRQFSRERAVWQDESFDRIVRDTDEFENILRYIAHNPVKRWPEVKEYPWVRILEEEMD